MDQFIIGSYADPPIPRPYMGSHFVQWTANTRWATIEHMRIAHRRFDIAVAQKLLDGSNVRPVFEQMRGKRMTKRVTGSSFCQTSQHHGISDSLLHERFVNMMAALFLRLEIVPSVLLGKDPLPAPVLRGVGILPVKGIWKLHTTPPISYILLVNSRDLLEVIRERDPVVCQESHHPLEPSNAVLGHAIGGQPPS